VKGGFAVGRGVQFAVVATHPQGWFHLDTIAVAMLLNEQPVEEAVFDVGAQTLSVTGQEPVPIGTPVTLSGSFFSVDAGKVRLVHEAFGVRLTLMVTPIAPIPRNSVFRTTSTDTEGTAISIRTVAPLAPGFLSWSTLALGVAVALFVGTFIGNTFSTRRHRRREPSVWDVLKRRLREESGWRPGLAPAEPERTP
jgi:hypothetical protein